MSTIAFCPLHNTPGKHDATGAFQPEAAAFCDHVVRVDNRATKALQRRLVLAEIVEARADCVAFFCHGWRTGIQLGFGLQHVDTLATALAIGSGAPTVALYACSTGSGPGVGGDGGFADALRDALCRAGATQCQVDAHATAGHCTRNPYVRRFDGFGSDTGGAGGYYLVAPGSELWPRWRKALQATDLRLRFPLMSVSEIHSELAG